LLQEIGSGWLKLMVENGREWLGNYYIIVKKGEKIVGIDLKNKIAITDTKARVKLYPTRKEAVEFYKKMDVER
jgi:hypothetical protein